MIFESERCFFGSEMSFWSLKLYFMGPKCVFDGPNCVFWVQTSFFRSIMLIQVPKYTILTQNTSLPYHTQPWPHLPPAPPTPPTPSRAPPTPCAAYTLPNLMHPCGYYQRHIPMAYPLVHPPPVPLVHPTHPLPYSLHPSTTPFPIDTSTVADPHLLSLLH